MGPGRPRGGRPAPSRSPMQSRTCWSRRSIIASRAWTWCPRARCRGRRIHRARAAVQATRGGVRRVHGARISLAPRVVMQMSSNESIKQAVMAGMGHIASCRCTRWDSSSITVLIASPETEGPAHPAPLARRQIPREKQLSPAAEAFPFISSSSAAKRSSRNNSRA